VPGGRDLAEAMDSETGGGRRWTPGVVTPGAIKTLGERRCVGAMVGGDRPRRHRRPAVHDGSPKQSAPYQRATHFTVAITQQ